MDFTKLRDAEWAGLGDRSLTPHARRMVTLGGTSWSFDTAARRLKSCATCTKIMS